MTPQLTPLTSEQRRAAYEQARQIVAGPVRALAEFASETVSEYSAKTMRYITWLAYLALFMAYLPSAIHIQDAAYQIALEAIGHQISAVVIAYCTVGLAESGILIFSLAFAVLPSGWLSKTFLFAGAFTSLALALAGNITQAEPHNLLSWLMAVAPPLLATGLTFVLKQQTLTANRNRRSAIIALQVASEKRNDILGRPEQSETWPVAWTSALWEAIRKANARGRGKADRIVIMNAMSTAQQIDLVRYEIAAHAGGLTSAMQSAPVVPEPVASEKQAEPVRKRTAKRTRNTNGSGLQNENIRPLANGKYEAFCKPCGFASELETRKGAINSYNAHSKKADHNANVAMQSVANTNGNTKTTEVMT